MFFRVVNLTVDRDDGFSLWDQKRHENGCDSGPQDCSHHGMKYFPEVKSLLGSLDNDFGGRLKDEILTGKCE